MANDDYRARGRVHDMRTTSKTRVKQYGGRGSNTGVKHPKRAQKRQDVINALASKKGMFGKMGRKLQKKQAARAGGVPPAAQGLAGMVQRGITNRANSMAQEQPTPAAVPDMAPHPATQPVQKVPTAKRTHGVAPTAKPSAPATPQPAPQPTGRPMPGAAPRGSGFRNRR